MHQKDIISKKNTLNIKHFVKIIDIFFILQYNDYSFEKSKCIGNSQNPIFLQMSFECSKIYKGGTHGRH